MSSRFRRLLPVLPVLGVMAVLPACSYSLQGRIVRGDASMVEVVSSNDPRLTEDPQSGVSGVTLHVQLDPSKLNRKTLARGASGRNGEFSLPIDEFGAGAFELDSAVYARKKGYEPAEGFFRLPGSDKRILITMAPGKDRPTSDQDEDMNAQFDRYK